MLEELLLKLRAVLAEVKHWPDQRAHARRRDDAIARAADLGRPQIVLIMCLGNICRSPYAEYKLRQLLADTPFADVAVRSAGLIGPGRPTPDAGQSVARAKGVDLSLHVSKTLAPSVTAGADVALVMAPAQAKALRGRVSVHSSRIFILGDFDPEPIRRREIKDPFKGDAALFEASYTRIDRCLEVFANALVSGNPGARG